jgi:hypothetical protein
MESKGPCRGRRQKRAGQVGAETEGDGRRRWEPGGDGPRGQSRYSTRWMMWKPNCVLTTPTSPTFSRSDSALNGGTRPASGVTG